ncbi:hypothetical protein KZ870_29620, partial [Pseudomonas aeruginosa]|nr:hypothetical protein [Pseudomonas aeruginosa]
MRRLRPARRAFQALLALVFCCLPHVGETGLAMDVRLFHEEITGLISDPLSVVDFSPDNGDRIRFSGA